MVARRQGLRPAGPGRADRSAIGAVVLDTYLHPRRSGRIFWAPQYKGTAALARRHAGGLRRPSARASERDGRPSAPSPRPEACRSRCASPATSGCPSSRSAAWRSRLDAAVSSADGDRRDRRARRRPPLSARPAGGQHRHRGRRGAADQRLAVLRGRRSATAAKKYLGLIAVPLDGKATRSAAPSSRRASSLAGRSGCAALVCLIATGWRYRRGCQEREQGRGAATV